MKGALEALSRVLRHDDQALDGSLQMYLQHSEARGPQYFLLAQSVVKVFVLAVYFWNVCPSITKRNLHSAQQCWLVRSSRLPSWSCAIQSRVFTMRDCPTFSAPP